MIIEFAGNDYKLGFGHFIYALVLAIFSTYILRDLSYNTAFVDEAIYATVGEEVLRGIFWESALSWMGGSYLYPVISALINRLYGLAGVRAFSYFCLFIAGICGGEIARKIGGRGARIFTVSLFFSSAIVLNLASLGTYDAPAILFFALSTLFAINSRTESKRKEILLILGSAILFLLSVLSKYIAIIFLPFLILFLMPADSKRFLKRILLFLLPFFCGFVIYSVINLDSLTNFFGSDAFKDTKDRVFIAINIAKLLNVYALVPFSLLFMLYKKPAHKYVLFVLFLAGLAPISYHLVFSNYRSVWKHLVLSLFLWSPIMGSSASLILSRFNKFTQVREIYSNVSQLVYAGLIAVVIFGLWLNMSDHWRFQRSWPSASASLQYLAKVRRPSDKVFAEGSAVYKYHLFDGFENPFSWTSTWYSEYKGETGIGAMRRAIEEQNFDYIILNGYYTLDVSRELTDLANIHYEKVLTDNYKVSGEYDTSTFVWARKGN